MKNFKSLLLLVAAIYSGCALPATISDDTLKLGKTTAANKQITFDIAAGTANPGIRWNNSGSQIEFANDGSSWNPLPQGLTASYGLENATLAASVGSNALTVALKDINGADPSASSPVKSAFRNATSTTGTYSVVNVTAALSVVVSSGSTLGHVSSQDQYVYVWAVNNAGTVVLAVSGQAVFDHYSIQSTTAEGGAGAADSGIILYSTAAQTSKAIRFLGRIKSNQSTAGTWASSPSEISVYTNYLKRLRSEVTYDTGNGHGATNTKIRRISTQRKSVGTDITYADTSNNGTSFTVSTDGIYAVTYCDIGSTTVAFGITINGSALTTTVTSVTYAQGKRCAVVTAGASFPACCTWTGNLLAGDIIRPQTDSAPNSSTDNVTMTVTKINE